MAAQQAGTEAQGLNYIARITGKKRQLLDICRDDNPNGWRITYIDATGMRLQVVNGLEALKRLIPRKEKHLKGIKKNSFCYVDELFQLEEFKWRVQVMEEAETAERGTKKGS